MLVRISDSYLGNFGYRDPDTGIVKLMTKDSGTFNLDDTEAERHIRNGVCVAVQEEVSPPSLPPVPDSAASDDNMSFKDLKALAKEKGINSAGKKREELEALVFGEAPVMTAEDPE